MLEIKKEKTAFICSLILVLLVVVLFLRIFYLQIIKGFEYEQLSQSVRARVIPKIAPRGRIYDRYGTIMAESKIIYDLYLLPYQLKEPEKIFTFLQKININTRHISKKYWKKKYLPYQSLLVKKDINIREISFLEENRGELQGIMIGSRIVRSYPYGSIACHVLGHVGEIDAAELKNLRNFGYKIGDIIGMAGVERYYDQYLKGINGGQPLEVDPLGNPVRKLVEMEPIPGASVYLTIDLELQKYAEKIFGKRKGAVVAVDPRTGEVLTMFSKPDYNPNYFTDVLTEKEWREILAKEHPLHNRALTGYPPGSIFKIITAMAALETKRFNVHQNYFCPGFFKLGGRRFDCWVKHGHGKLNFLQGFVQSCNVVFYNLGLFLGPKKISQAAANFGLGLATNIDLPFESLGLIPTKKWKKRIYKQEWFPGDSVNMAIGQGYILTTPIQMAMVVASVGNKERHILQPFLAKKVISSEDEVLMEREKEIIARLSFSKKNIQSIKNLMRDVVKKGTGINSKVKNYAVCGKTGTAEIGKNRKTHAWFVSFAPYEDPEIAIVVFVESGGFGGEIAAGIARQLYQWWYRERSIYAAKE